MHIGKALDDRAAQFLQPALNRTEMFIVADSTVANDDIGTSVEDRRDDPGYVFADILPVGVGVDDDVGARGERRIDARAERRGKAALGAVAHDMVRTPHAGDLRCIVGAAVRSEEHTSELQSLMRTSYAGLVLKKK